MLPGVKADAIQLWALLAMNDIEKCTMIFAIVQFLLQGAFGIQDRNTFGWGGSVGLRRLFAVPFGQVGGVVANGGQEGEE